MIASSASSYYPKVTDEGPLALHDDYGYLGMEKTLGLLQEWFFWPKMMEDV